MTKKVVILVRQAGLGNVDATDEAFGVEMFDRFIHSLEGQEIKPYAICLYTRGVTLACQGSAVVFGLKMLQGMGVQILICKSCLEHYDLANKVMAGEIRGMAEIAELLMEADRVITV